MDTKLKKLGEKIMKILNKTMLAFALIGSMSMALVQIVRASVPFKGRGDGEITAVQPVGTGVLMTVVGAGQATQLGQFSRIENILLDPANGTFTGDMTFIAANGDHLTCDILGGFTSATTASGSYTFTGGTGRFANAGGTASFAASLSDQVHVTFEFSGSLNN